MVRYSTPLEQFAPACRQHMTDAERTDIDGNPLWSDEGQVLWLLELRGGDAGAGLVPSSTIARQLKLQPHIASHALTKLRAQGKVRSRSRGNHELWGTADHVLRLERVEQAAEAKQLAERHHVMAQNRLLDQLRAELEKVLAGRDIAVSSLARAFPGRSADPRRDQLMLHVGDPEEAAWLLSRLRGPAEHETSGGVE